MKQYTIYCTEEQCEKALKLGAPIERVSHSLGEPFRPECTAEQMIGWFCENGIYIEAHKTYCFPIWHLSVTSDDKHIDSSFEGYETRKEATLAAIDVALDYLTNNKK